MSRRNDNILYAYRECLEAEPHLPRHILVWTTIAKFEGNSILGTRDPDEQFNRVLLLVARAHPLP